MTFVICSFDKSRRLQILKDALIAIARTNKMTEIITHCLIRPYQTLSARENHFRRTKKRVSAAWNDDTRPNTPTVTSVLTLRRTAVNFMLYTRQVGGVGGAL